MLPSNAGEPSAAGLGEQGVTLGLGQQQIIHLCLHRTFPLTAFKQNASVEKGDKPTSPRGLFSQSLSSFPSPLCSKQKKDRGFKFCWLQSRYPHFYLNL